MGSKIFHSKAYKTIMNYVYGWGACAVIVGALFKIMHFPGAGYVLSIGMIVEAFIFFMSAFEPQPEHYEWSKVFPELSDKLGETSEVSGISPRSPQGTGVGLLGEEDAEKLKASLARLTETAQGISKISDAVAATEKYSDSMNSVSSVMKSFSDKGENAAAALENITNSGNKLSENIDGFIEGVNNSGNEFKKLGELAGNYGDFIKQFEIDYKGGSTSVIENMGALNALYEIQIKNTEDYVNKFKDVQKNVEEMTENVSAALNNTKVHKKESEELGENISNLNSIYGNMLSVMNNSKSSK